MSLTAERDAGEHKRNPIPFWTTLNSGSEDYIRSRSYSVITLLSEDFTETVRGEQGVTSLEETFQQLRKRNH